MRASVQNLIVLLAGASMLVGCATRGQLREGLEEQRTQLEGQIQTERGERMEADQRLEGEIGAVRSDVEGLRREFGARIDSLAAGMQFAFPLQFAFDEAQVEPSDMAALERFAEVVQRHYPGALITVAGFADPAGSAAYNRRLSERRAEAVRERLVQLGLAPAQVRAVGFGEEHPVVPGAAASQPGAEMNRRVVFMVETRGAPAAMGTPMSPTGR